MRTCALRAPVFLGSLQRQTGRCAPPPRPSQLRCFLFDPQKYLQSIELGPPTSRASFFPMDHRGYEIWGPLPRTAHRSFADPSGQIFGVKLCSNATICPNFFVFFYSFWAFFCYSLLFLISFSLSSYSSLLILLFLSLLILLVGAILRLLILPFFDPFGVKFMYIPVQPYVLTIFVLFFFINIMSPAPPIAASLILTALY